MNDFNLMLPASVRRNVPAPPPNWCALNVVQGLSEAWFSRLLGCGLSALGGGTSTPMNVETFAQRFGPERMKELNGPELLSLMHEHGNQDSLVYWLEFKNDEEFPGIQFGSIAGGSALKFGLYRRKETGKWMTGPPVQQREISMDEAVAMAESHRDQLMHGHKLLREVTGDTDDATYFQLQEQLDTEMPDLANLAWAHKYLTLLHTDSLDDYHNPDLQRYHLLRLLQRPPERSGRYACAGRYVSLARELGMPVNHLTRPSAPIRLPRTDAAARAARHRRTW